MTETPFDAEADEDAPDSKRNLVIAGTAVGAIALVGVAYLLLSGGGSGSDSATQSGVVPHGAFKGNVAASPSPSPSAVDVLQTTKVSGNDPFQVPTRILQALTVPVAPVAASAAASPSGAAQSGTPAGTDVGTPGGTTGSGTGSSTSSGGSPVSSVQFVQLLGAKKHGSKWSVTVRTNHGTCTGVKQGTVKVCGTDFTFSSEDELAGKQTFVFIFGEVQGGNLTPNAKQKASPVKAGDSALVAVNGKVDGGLSSEN